MKSIGKTYFKSLFLSFLIYCSFSLHAQEKVLQLKNEIPRDSVSQLFIDPKYLDENEKAIFIKALSELTSKKQFYDTIKIKQLQTVYSIIKKNYNFDDSKNYKTSSSRNNYKRKQVR
jgi:hypothetical protein